MLKRLAPLAVPLLLAGAPSCKGGQSSSSSASPADGSSAVAAASAPPPAPAAGSAGPEFEGDLTMHFQGAGRAPHDITMTLKGGKVRLDIPAEGGRTAHAIYDFASNSALVLLDERKMALEMPVPAPSAEPVQGLPPEITKTGKHETVAGHDCEDWDVVEALGHKHEQVCVAEGIVFFDFTKVAPPGSTGVIFGTWVKQIRENHEFPLRIVRFDADGKEESHMEVTKIEAKPIDDALFTRPAGYRTFDINKMGSAPNGLNNRPKPY